MVKTAIFGLPELSEIDINAVNTQVEYIGNELLMTKHTILNEVYTLLGINNVNTNKRERLITSEVEANNEAVEMYRLSGLNARRQACKEINEKFGLNVNVVWRTDYISENFETINNLEDMAETLGEVK